MTNRTDEARRIAWDICSGIVFHGEEQANKIRERIAKAIASGVQQEACATEKSAEKVAKMFIGLESQEVQMAADCIKQYSASQARPLVEALEKIREEMALGSDLKADEISHQALTAHKENLQS